MLGSDEGKTSVALDAGSGLQYMTAWFSLVGPPLRLQLDTSCV